MMLEDKAGGRGGGSVPSSVRPSIEAKETKYRGKRDLVRGVGAQ